MSEPKTFRSTVSARGHNQLIANVRGSAVDTARAIGIIASSLLRSVTDIVRRAEALHRFTGVALDLVVPDGMGRDDEIRLYDAFRAAADRDPGLRASALGRATQLRWVRSGPAQPERPPVPAAVEAPKPVEAKRDAEPVAPRAFDPLGDLQTQLHARDSWREVKRELGRRHDLAEPSITIGVPEGMDADLLLDFIAAEAANDQDALGFARLTLHAGGPAVA